jgi:hypothetical protein
MSVALQFGRRTVAVASSDDSRRYGGGRVIPMDRATAKTAGGARVGRAPRVGYAPSEAGGARVGECSPAAVPPGTTQAWCYSTGTANPIPIGSGNVSIPAAVGNTPGTNTLTLQPVEAFTMVDIQVTDPTGQVMFSSIKAGRCDFIEAGTINSQAFAPNGTQCKMFEGFNIFPNSGLIFTAQNPTLAPVTVSVTGRGIPVPCPQGQTAPR